MVKTTAALVALAASTSAVTGDVLADTCLATKPYVEETCRDTTYNGWPYGAKSCTYGSPKGPLQVTVADPDAHVVSKWIGNATREVNWVAKLETEDHASFAEVKKILATDIMIQSGRIFPLSGYIGEDMGTGYVAYHFTSGIADGCPTGEPHAFCRINSLTRGQLCHWRDHKNMETETHCKTRLGYAQGNTQAWYDECMQNHINSWYSEYNPHIVAKLWTLLDEMGVNGKSSGAQITSALYTQLGFSSKTVSAFCG